jgi:hypothetical protein
MDRVNTPEIVLHMLEVARAQQCGTVVVGSRCMDYRLLCSPTSAIPCFVRGTIRRSGTSSGSSHGRFGREGNPMRPSDLHCFPPTGGHRDGLGAAMPPPLASIAEGLEDAHGAPRPCLAGSVRTGETICRKPLSTCRIR